MFHWEHGSDSLMDNPSGGLQMAITIESLGIDRMSVSDRLSLVQQIWDSIAAEPAQLPLTDAQREELERRLVDDEENPDDAVTWEQVRDEALARWSMTRAIILRRVVRVEFDE
jgi:putative addiction module component (TIGR02574 family)